MLDSSTAVKGFFTPFMHSRCRKSVGSVYLTLLGVCEKPPLTAVEESQHLGAKMFDKEHNKLTIKMAKIPKQC